MKFCQCLVANEIDEVEPCGNLCEGSTDMCASHNAFFRKLKKQNQKAEEKRNSQIAKAQKRNQEPRKLPSKVSDKRKELNKEYATLRPQYLLEHPNCEMKLMGCDGASVEIHHTASGSNKVAHLNDTLTWKATCGHCHRMLHDKLSAGKARELGLKV